MIEAINEENKEKTDESDKSNLLKWQVLTQKIMERARKEYRRSKKQKADINELFILDIMREGIKNGDARLS